MILAKAQALFQACIFGSFYLNYRMQVQSYEFLRQIRKNSRYGYFIPTGSYIGPAWANKTIYTILREFPWKLETT